ncbi:unnamed protein product, partial [Didymodactylos carnosus]
CDNGYILDDNGCPTCTCLCLKQITCKRNCGNWGYKTDEQGCPLCECNCPLRRCWQQCGDLGYKADEYGCMGCECNCPLVKCSTQCAYGFKQNDYGCQTCQCACETLGCKRKCDYGFKTNNENCTICECKESKCPFGYSTGTCGGKEQLKCEGNTTCIVVQKDGQENNLPFKYETLIYIPNTFFNYKQNYLTQTMRYDWINVQFLLLHDINHQQYSVEFFKLIKKEFVNLNILGMAANCSLDNQLTHDRQLTLDRVNMFALSEGNMDRDFGKRMPLMVPMIQTLHIPLKNLIDITNNFSDQDLRMICSNVCKIIFSDDNDNLIHSKEYVDYFPNLLN